MDRAEKLKAHIEEEKGTGKYHEQVHIENNATGHSYERLFGRFLDSSVTSVEVEDPYIMSIHQLGGGGLVFGGEGGGGGGGGGVGGGGGGGGGKKGMTRNHRPHKMGSPGPHWHASAPPPPLVYSVYAGMLRLLNALQIMLLNKGSVQQFTSIASRSITSVSKEANLAQFVLVSIYSVCTAVSSQQSHHSSLITVVQILGQMVASVTWEDVRNTWH
ncbi:hypothetical protein LSAT2_031376 [Lamellibrachia satsuma]|nr:hypothetical protein LSAT2_031376 [Lamellibrachia satsuma]